jgi:23S rRNA maturation mini-RNase III
VKLNVHVENKFEELHGVNLVLCGRAIVDYIVRFWILPFLRAMFVNSS